jgi:hypothetical protein
MSQEKAKAMRKKEISGWRASTPPRAEVGRPAASAVVMSRLLSFGSVYARDVRLASSVPRRGSGAVRTAHTQTRR